MNEKNNQNNQVPQQTIPVDNNQQSSQVSNLNESQAPSSIQHSDNTPEASTNFTIRDQGTYKEPSYSNPANGDNK